MEWLKTMVKSFFKKPEPVEKINISVSIQDKLPEESVQQRAIKLITAVNSLEREDSAKLDAAISKLATIIVPKTARGLGNTGNHSSQSK